MPTPPVPDDQPQVAEAASTPGTPSPAAASSLRHNLTSAAAAGLLISFFLPWITMLGAKLNGVEVAKNFSSYKFVWIMPLLAIAALVMNLAKLPAKVISQLAGVSPFFILCYAVYRLNANLTDLVKLLEFGAWLALIFGLMLGIVSRNPNKPTTSI